MSGSRAALRLGRVSISYTTVTGSTIECSIDYFNPEVLYVQTSTDVSDYLSSQEWSGVGQRIYDLAMERLDVNDPRTLQPSEFPEGVITPPTPQQRDQQAWVLAQSLLIDDKITANDFDWNGFVSQTTCTPAVLR